ncbi:MAG TPA: CdaR family protein [Chthonomonadaceae bacterium]|nr:CdaR family protein [Chthonomonadaceae bacterium]
MLMQLRQNLFLKAISLIAAILLYVYVQAERNPIVTRPLTIKIQREHVPPDVDVQSDQQQLAIMVTGPRALVDTLKDTDIVAVANLAHVGSGEQRVHLTYRFQRLPVESTQDLGIDPPTPTVHFVLHPPQLMPVQVAFHNEPPPGFHYGRPEVRPAHVKVVGSADAVRRVAHLVVNAVAPEVGSPIEGDFPVQAWNADNNPVEEVKLLPALVHVTVPLSTEPSARTVLVSPSILDLPLPPYQIKSLSVAPQQVKITGRPERLIEISTLNTEDISVRDLTSNKEFIVGLVVPSGVTVHDMAGHLIHTVHVGVLIGRAAAAPPTLPQETSPAGTAP